MDKRFLLALVLTAVVVIATPILFRTPVTSVSSDTSVAVSADSTQKAPSAPAVIEAPRDSIPVAATQTPDTTTRTAAVAPETTTVSTAVATYRFNTLGAAPIAVEIKSYKALDGSSRNVELASASGRLLAYRLYLPGDTIDLSRTVFRLDRTTTPNGADLLTYRAIVAGTDVAIRYAFAPDSYLVRVSGEVRNAATTNGFLAVEMPSNLHSAEADSLDDQQHLAIAVKPQRDNARGIPFNKLDPGERRLEPGPIAWAAAKNKYFIIGLLTAEGDAPTRG